MPVKNLYQTLEDNYNPDPIEQEGPFICNRKDAWLGKGYYFWDTFIELAHWWGNHYYKDSYIICHAICDYRYDECYDLTNPETIKEFSEIINAIRKQNIPLTNKTVPTIINYLKSINQFPYMVIRANAMNTIAADNPHFTKFKMPFQSKYPAYLDLRPPYQLCFLTKKAFNLRDYRIVHPPEYTEGYVV